jgi:flagellar hook-basal body complex protein FliE
VAINPIGGVTPTAIAQIKPPATTGGFGEVLTSNLENLERVQTQADNLAKQAATGDLTDVHDFMIAANKASLATELTVAVRNKAVEAFNEVMRMQI